MTLQHPMDKLSAVVDGELDHDSRDKVLSHLVGCDTCRAEVDAQRRLKARMAALESPEPVHRPDAAPDGRLVVLPRAARGGPSGAHAGGHRSSRSGPRSRPGASGGTRPGAPRTTRSRRRTGVLGAAGSAAAVASLLGTAFVVGDPARLGAAAGAAAAGRELLLRPREHDGRSAVRRPGRAAELLQRDWVRRAEPDAAAGGPDRTLTREPLPARRPGQHRSDRLRPAHARLRRRPLPRVRTRRRRSAG